MLISMKNVNLNSLNHDAKNFDIKLLQKTYYFI